jgi:type IV secretion system protein VirB9
MKYKSNTLIKAIDAKEETAKSGQEKEPNYEITRDCHPGLGSRQGCLARIAQFGEQTRPQDVGYFQRGGQRQDNPTTGASWTKRAALILALGLPLASGDISSINRTIQYSENAPIPHVYTRTGFSTEVILPKQETVVKVLISNSYFQTDYTGNKVDLKAMGDEPGHAADVRIYAASGNEYSVLIEEVSKRSTSADLRVILLADDQSTVDAMNGKPKLYTADQVEGIQAQLAAERAALKQEQEKAARSVQLAATKEANTLKHDYTLESHKGESFRTAIYHDDKFTYVEFDSQEAPALYEVKDGKLSQVEKQMVGRKYTVPKIVDDLVLKVGKSYEKWHRISSES